MHTLVLYLHGERILPLRLSPYFGLLESSIDSSRANRIRTSVASVRTAGQRWLFGLCLYHPVDRFSLQLPGRAEALKASCWDSADRRLLRGADIIRVESRALLLFGFSEGKRELKKERWMERGGVEAGFKQCEVKIVAQLPWQRRALGGQSIWLLTLPRSPWLLLKTIILPISLCRFHIHHFLCLLLLLLLCKVLRTPPSPSVTIVWPTFSCG